MGNNSIIKNSILLYSRMFISMIVSFYTTRVVLSVLGVEDYGLRNVVAGFASMFTYFNGVLQAGTSRFIALYLGSGNYDKLKKCFSNAIIIHICIALFILVLAESFGIWFVNSELNIDPTRYYAANWVFQLSIVGCIISVIQTPYVAITTAYEKFNIYAYLSIFDVILKLVIVYLITTIKGDKLIIYSFLLLCTQIITFLLYFIITKKSFKECSGKIITDKKMIKEMLTFSGWTATGNLSVILSNQGLNVIMNIFYGTIVNAAKGLADTITWLVKSFASSVITATVPRMTKLYGDNKLEELKKLVMDSSQICVFFITIFALPVILEIDTFMNIWLTEVPEYTTIFIKIVLINSIYTFPTTTLEQCINAIGKVKKATIYLSPVYLSYFPIAYIIMHKGGTPVMVYSCLFLISTMALITQLYILRNSINFNVMKYLIKIPITSILVFAISYGICYSIQNMIQPSLMRLIIICSISMFLYTILYLYIVLSKENRQKIAHTIKRKLHI